MKILRPDHALLCLCLSLAALGGCGSRSGGGASGPVASHGGTLIELPNRAGLVELIAEKVDAKARGRRVMGKVVAYFTNSQGDAAPEPAPTDVAFVDEEGKRHPMVARTGATTAACFESDPIFIAEGEPTGTIEAKLGGEAVRLVNRPR